MLYNALITSHIDDNTSIVLTDMTKQYTYTQIDQICHRVGCQLKRYGVKPLDRVIIRADRTLDTVLIILSCIRLGVCFIPVSPAVSEEMLLDIIKDSSPVLVVGSFEQEEMLQRIQKCLMTLENCTARKQDLMRHPFRLIVPEVVQIVTDWDILSQICILWEIFVLRVINVVEDAILILF